MAFYVTTSLTMCLALFNLAVCSFLVVNAQGLMLRGPPDSVARCVAILGGYWQLIRNVLALSLLSLLSSAISICWMKLEMVEWHPGPAVACTALVGVIGSVGLYKMCRLAQELSIPNQHIVEGDLTIATSSGASVDIMAEQNAVIPVASN